MMDDPASLDLLHDIVVPGPVPWWPPALGWYVILAILSLAVLGLALRALRRHLRNAYRREALAAIGGARASAADLAALLKRAAITAYPREEVAGLTGQAWVDWLARTSGIVIEPAVAKMLTVGVYTSGLEAETTALAEFAARWIRRHSPRGTGSPRC